MRRFHRVSLIVAFALLIPFSSVFAASATLYGHLNHDGSLTQFSTWRYHDHTGTIAAYIDNPPNGGGQLRLGIRNTRARHEISPLMAASSITHRAYRTGA